MFRLRPLRKHRWSIALAAAALADSVTFLVMGVEHEANPIAAAFPAAAIAAKFLLVVAILALPLGQYATNVKVTGALAWALGAFTNVLVIWR
ncbi:MAG: hypothetical protein ACO3PB_08385 [Miltoncostaeaceae bacterium]